MMKKIAILYFLGALLLSGCVRDEFDTTRVEEGLAAHVGLKMVMPDMGGEHGEGSTRSTADTRAVDDDVENRLETLRVLIFDSNGDIVTNNVYTEQSAGSLSSLRIETRSGGNRTFCFVANSKDDMDERLSAITSYDALREFVMTASGLSFGLNSTDPLIMTAIVENVNVQPGNNAIDTPVQLQYLAAKLTLRVIDETPVEHTVSVIGWDVLDAPARSYLFANDTDVNPDPDTSADKDEYWMTTSVDYPFEKEDFVTIHQITVTRSVKRFSQTLYFFENRRGGRVPNTLPTNPDERYPNMDQSDWDQRGKAWFKPKRATAIVITAMHKTVDAAKEIKAYIYLGADAYKDYNIRRGHHYTIDVRVRGINNIQIDTNLKVADGNFVVDYGENLTMDAHPDFRPMRMHAANGTGTMEILDSQGRTYDEPGFDATWLKISPLNLMYHQVKQSPPNDEWQQAAEPQSKIVRPKYIPHKSVREKLASKGGWNTIPADKEDDDNMTFADATYRMCYKITDIPFAEVTVTNQTLHVYADEFLERDGDRTAKVRFTYRNNATGVEEVKTITVSQKGYYSFYLDDNDPNAGLCVLNEDGTPSNVRKKMVGERFPEYKLTMNPGVSPVLQNLLSMEWGFPNSYMYSGDDKYRNGKYLTANLVYKDVVRKDNEPVEFGLGSDSYRNMFNGGALGVDGKPLQAYTGTNTGAPYYYPDPAGDIYHPIYKSSAARYCFEKNRDLNGDGIIDDSETFWYLPALNEVYLLAIAANVEDFAFGGGVHQSSTEGGATYMRTVTMYGGQGTGSYLYPNFSGAGKDYGSQLHKITRCWRELK